MKKIFISMIAAVALLTSCDPVEDKYSNNAKDFPAGELAERVTFTQTDADGNPQADGNYFTFTTNPSTIVTIYTLRADGSENVLSRGTASGSFRYAPSRGSDSEQTIYVRAMNGDGTLIEAAKTVMVFVPGELEPAVKLLASNDYGSKTWKWDPSITGAVWGNMGYCGGAGSAVGQHGEGQWWGVTSTDEFNGQLGHSADGVNHGDGDLNAYMVFSEDGLIQCFDASGSVIREGTFAVNNHDPSDPAAWKVGDLVTSEGAILWPYQINWKDNGFEPYPTTFEIVYLTADKMTLVYPDGGDFGGLGNWGEATFWHFCSDTDLSGMAAGYDDGKSWTWDTSITGAVWGNMGYCGGNGAAVGTSGEGQWWGVTSTDEFNGQLGHSEDGVNHGDGDLDAFMVLGTDGIIKRCAADGSVISSGTYEFVPIKGNAWKVAELNTTAGTILWPYQINWKDNGFEPCPTTFEVVYLTGDKMTLVYPDGGDFGGLGNWGEATFWHFKAK